MHEAHFFELAGTEPVIVEFIAQPKQADALLDRLQTAGIQVLYVRLEADFGIVGMG